MIYFISTEQFYNFHNSADIYLFVTLYVNDYIFFLIVTDEFSPFTAMCDPACENNGTCMSPEVCICPDGFSGKRCERGKDGASNQCMLCVCFFWLKCMCMETRKTKFDSTRYINQFLKDFIKIDGFKIQSLK